MKIRKRVNAHQDGPETSAPIVVNQVSTAKTARIHANVSTARHAITFTVRIVCKRFYVSLSALF